MLNSLRHQQNQERFFCGCRGMEQRCVILKLKLNHSISHLWLVDRSMSSKAGKTLYPTSFTTNMPRSLLRCSACKSTWIKSFEAEQERRVGFVTAYLNPLDDRGMFIFQVHISILMNVLSTPHRFCYNSFASLSLALGRHLFRGKIHVVWLLPQGFSQTAHFLKTAPLVALFLITSQCERG